MGIQYRELMDKFITLKVAEEFTKTPGVREEIEGNFPGEQFLKEVLLLKFEQALKENIKLLVDLDGASGYPTSFLEAAFGGLVRHYKSVQTVRDNLIFISKDDPYLIGDIEEYINDALKKDV